MQTSQHNTMTYNTVAGNVMSSPPHTAMNTPNNTMLPPNNTTMVTPQQNAMGTGNMNAMVANNNTMVVQQNVMVAPQSAMMAAAPQGVMMAPNNIVRSQMLVGGVMSQQQQQQQLAWQQQVGVAGRMQMVYQTDNSGVRPATQFNAANQGQMLQLMQQQQQRQQAPQSGGAQMMLGQQTMQAQVGLVRQQVSRPSAAMAGVQARPGAPGGTQQFMNVSVAPQRMVGIMRAPGDHGLHLRIPAPGGLVPGAEEVTPLTPQDQLQRFIDQL